MYEERLLAIEDDEPIAALIGKVATEAGFATATVSKPQDIETHYQLIRPHAIILDILMPELDGFDVLEFLHKQQSKARIIILSGSHYRDMAERIGEAYGLQIVASLPKPFRVQQLRVTLQEIRYSLQVDAGMPLPSSLKVS